MVRAWEHNVRGVMAIAVQVEKLSVRCPRTARTPVEIKPRRQEHRCASTRPLVGGAVIGQEGGCAPLTKGRCRDCLVWDADEACQSVWSETTVNYCRFALTRGFERMYAATSENARGLRHRCASLLRGKTKSTRQAV